MTETKKCQAIEELAKSIDISCVQAFHTRNEIDLMINAARKYRFCCVFTLPSFSSYVAEKLQNEPDIHTGGVVSFPGGGDTICQKGNQARELYEMGCDEIDMVMNISAFKDREYSYVTEDIMTVIDHAGKIPVKVIIEAPYLTESEIRKAVEICITSGAAYVKTSTGWHSEKTKLEHIQIISSQANGRIKIKAAGGIRTLETIQQMKKEGCSRFGLGFPSAIEIIKDMNV